MSKARHLFSLEEIHTFLEEIHPGHTCGSSGANRGTPSHGAQHSSPPRVMPMTLLLTTGGRMHQAL